MACLACAKPPPPQAPREASRASHAPLHHGPLADYVPAAGLHWLIQAKPRALFENPVTSRMIAGLVPHAGLAAFAAASGVDLRQVPDALVAGFDYSTLYLASLPPGVAATARNRFEERLVAGSIDKRPYPGIRRLTGVVGQTPETLLTLDESTLAVTVGDPTPSRVVEAFARGQLKSSPSALHGSALHGFPDLTNNLVLALAPGPFPEDWQRAGLGLFASTVACGAALHPIEPDSLGVTFVLLGDFSENPKRAGEVLERAWASLIGSPTGRLLGLDQASPPHVDALPERLTLEIVLPLTPLVHGLRAAILTDVSEILRLTPRADPPAAPAPTAPD